MKSKKTIMGYAALLILIFHFYIPFLGIKAETIFARAAYVGVDLFFFLSGSSLGRRKKMEPVPFYLNRLKTIYFPFAVLCCVCAVYKRWALSRLVSVLVGWELLQRNGGAFLWYFSGLMLLYLFVPLFAKAKEKWGCKAFFLLMAIWLAIAVVLQYALGYKKISILLMRVPVFLLGFFPELWEKIRLGKWKAPVFLAMLAVGWVLTVRYGALYRLNKPLADFYYIVTLPRTLGIVGLFQLLPDHPAAFRPLEFIGRYTAELYGLQMVFGYDVESRLLKLIGSPILTFLLTLLILLMGAIAFHWLMQKSEKLLFERKETEK